MQILGNILSIFFATLIFSAFGLGFAMIPPLALGIVLEASSINWRIPATQHTAESKVHYVWLSILGGLAGTFSAVSALIVGEWWLCYSEKQLCYDGQGDLVLIFTVPVLAFCGALASLFWTWFTLRLAPTRLWASFFRYSGPNRLLNRAYSLLVPIFLWLFTTYAVYRITLHW